ncbi:peptidase associated/transthyretin-like domain-containing protein [Flavobacterium glaciei]|uniref:Carboxypeptidase-like protein n=1 Tax=Flavobacterium glaciei TaxID=386300 RepID=A0A562Q1M0_9FLAO|nr:hypothetical protein [Flavobacterium glaciei]RDI57662.1 hypothetical protein DFR66_102285 [Flavobacterium glaciei]TWI50538.1 hypothetical protein IQ02_00433 [Flavobacterium glaciei]
MKYLIILLFSTTLYAQDKYNKILWNKTDNIPVEFATIKSNEQYSLSNSEGYFEILKNQDVIIQCLGYNTLELQYNDLISKDTIYLQPKIFEMDEVVIVAEDVYKKMVKTVLSEYALEPHTEKFFLRVVVKRNEELYKIIDFSGYVEKQTLFESSQKPDLKVDYKVQINNIRKVGWENKTIDYALFNFNQFFTEIAAIVLKPDIYKLNYEISDDNTFSKIIAKPKEPEINFTNGKYLLNEDNTFGNVEIISNLNSIPYSNLGKHKHRTTYYFKNSSFERNRFNNKMQLNKSIIKATTEVITKEGDKQVFEVTYFYNSNPVQNITVKNNVSLKKDIFDIKMDYNEEYWKNNDNILPLTTEMQRFVNKINSEVKTKEFRTISNIK